MKIVNGVCRFIGLFLFCFLFVGCAGPRIDIESLRFDSDESSYLVLNLAEKAFYIDKLIFHNVDENQDYEIEVDKREYWTLVLSLPAGSYYLRRLDMIFENTMSLRFPQPEELLVFKKNSIHYLGDLSWKRRLVYVNYSKEVVTQAMEDNPWVFKARDVYVLNHLFGDPSIEFVRPPGVPRA